LRNAWQLLRGGIRAEEEEEQEEEDFHTENAAWCRNLANALHSTGLSTPFPALRQPATDSLTPSARLLESNHCF